MFWNGADWKQKSKTFYMQWLCKRHLALWGQPFSHCWSWQTQSAGAKYCKCSGFDNVASKRLSEYTKCKAMLWQLKIYCDLYACFGSGFRCACSQPCISLLSHTKETEMLLALVPKEVSSWLCTTPRLINKLVSIFLVCSASAERCFPILRGLPTEQSCKEDRLSSCTWTEGI